ncbi:hypothetical protein CK203_043339 [Vitis vinifera]|uniref:Uncharacterized protein n=1 Tax=Vitis vinifera TaxID=29760 RepID=A0A438GYB5_VITVI|nr:hypothetical protein CK203_043339 [Vitis vinifera]
MGRVWKVLEMPRDVHPSLHYGEGMRGVQDFLENSRDLLYFLVHGLVRVSFGQSTKQVSSKELVKLPLSNKVSILYVLPTTPSKASKARLRSGYSEGSMSGSNVKETSEQTRGRETKPTARGRGSMEKGLKDLREQIQDLREGVLGSQVQSVSHEEFMSFQDKVMSMFASMELRVEACCTHGGLRLGARVEVPKPHTFNGKRDAKEFDNFLWHMERYFEAIALTDEATKAKQELRRRGVQDLATAMAGSLVKYKRGDSSKPKPQSKGNHAKGGRGKGSRGYTPKEGSEQDL